MVGAHLAFALIGLLIMKGVSVRNSSMDKRVSGLVEDAVLP